MTNKSFGRLWRGNELLRTLMEPTQSFSVFQKQCMDSGNGEISMNVNNQGRFQSQIYLFSPFKKKDGVGEV